MQSLLRLRLYGFLWLVRSEPKRHRDVLLDACGVRADSPDSLSVRKSIRDRKACIEVRLCKSPCKLYCSFFELLSVVRAQARSLTVVQGAALQPQRRDVGRGLRRVGHRLLPVRKRSALSMHCHAFAWGRVHGIFTSILVVVSIFRTTVPAMISGDTFTRLIRLFLSLTQGGGHDACWLNKGPQGQSDPH